jgi:TFIIH basal transcription factor complex TTD-A subunit
MNEKQSFIIEDLDDHHLVIKADEEYRVRRELETEVPSSSLALPTLAYHDVSSRRTLTAWIDVFAIILKVGYDILVLV